ncbi:phospholipid phosphatase 2-like isoform X1 [Oncorhynchus clarkii lewisi]|uniref:phospholipid phosphatase 2-like isoform X1 n=1 Tax=Oncorhynchus clarkii lewisi TaxID=490388 RepID=UPI0039B9BB97
MTELPVHKKNMLILVDVLCVFVAALPSAVLTLMFSPYQRGIYCDDESIRYPYRRDTISHRAMAAVTIPSSIVIITTGEAYLVYSKRLHSNSNFNQYMSALYKVVGTFLFGAAVSQSLTDLAKFTIGRPRPNFLSVCNPTVCSGYMLQLNCTGNPRNVTESRLSFYSGHSAFGMYSMLFLALYVQARMQGKWTRLVRPTVQFFLVAFALYVGYTRVSDYKHHWSDVLVGLLQGTLIAVLNVCYVSDFFKLRPPPRCPRSEAAEDEHLEAKPGLDPDTQLHNNHYNYATTSAQTQTNNYTTTTATTQQPLHNNHGNRGEVA